MYKRKITIAFYTYLSSAECEEIILLWDYLGEKVSTGKALVSTCNWEKLMNISQLKIIASIKVLLLLLEVRYLGHKSNINLD